MRRRPGGRVPVPAVPGPEHLSKPLPKLQRRLAALCCYRSPADQRRVPLSENQPAKKPRTPTGHRDEFDLRARRRLVRRRRGADRRRPGYRKIHAAAAGAGSNLAGDGKCRLLRERRQGRRAASSTLCARVGCTDAAALQRLENQPRKSPPQMLARSTNESSPHREGACAWRSIDSIQTVDSETLQSAPARSFVVRECRSSSPAYAKQSGTSLILVGHVTKGRHAGRSACSSNIVDTVLYFEGDTHPASRLIRAFKNRYGAVNELGVFAATGSAACAVCPILGDLSARNAAGRRFLRADHPGGHAPAAGRGPGAWSTVPQSPNPRRLSVGLEQNRLAMLLAVMHRHVGLVCYDQDVFGQRGRRASRSPSRSRSRDPVPIVSCCAKSRALLARLAVFGEVGRDEIRSGGQGAPERSRQARLHRHRSARQCAEASDRGPEGDCGRAREEAQQLRGL